ncbi:hypothetical protein IQ255_21495 [Pleurocapsales cyanobacterium LEGE 10410]|nr:hypothetical protein [Pleurocapsales cyanobacterium LEGE 10410]
MNKHYRDRYQPRLETENEFANQCAWNWRATPRIFNPLGNARVGELDLIHSDRTKRRIQLDIQDNRFRN